jgi:hypothetical protein
LAIATNPQAILDDVNLYFHLKPESVGHPNIYLGSKVSKATLSNGVECWCNSSCQYVKEAIKNTESYITKHNGKMLKSKTKLPMETNYCPELDITPVLSPINANYYQSQIGVLRWCVKLGHLDITTKVSMLSSHNALPRASHLDAVFRIFSYLKTKTNARLVLRMQTLIMTPLQSKTGASFMATRKSIYRQRARAYTGQCAAAARQTSRGTLLR